MIMIIIFCVTEREIDLIIYQRILENLAGLMSMISAKGSFIPGESSQNGHEENVIIIPI